MAIATDEILKLEVFKIERFEALGLGRVEAIQAVEAGVDWRSVEWLVAGLPRRRNRSLSLTRSAYNFHAFRLELTRDTSCPREKLTPRAQDRIRRARRAPPRVT